MSPQEFEKCKEKEMAKLKKILPYDNFIALGNKYIKDAAKYNEDLKELRNLLKLIDESKPLRMANLLRRTDEQNAVDDFALFTPMNLDGD